MNGRYLLVCRIVSTTLWVKTTYKIFVLQAYRIFVKLALLVLGGGPMSCPNVGVEFRNQSLSYMMPMWVGFLSIRTRPGYATPVLYGSDYNHL